MNRVCQGGRQEHGCGRGGHREGHVGLCGSLDKHVEVTHIYRTTVGLILEEQGEHHRTELEAAAGREIAPADEVVVYEIHEASVVTSKLAIEGHFKTGHRAAART